MDNYFIYNKEFSYANDSKYVYKSDQYGLSTTSTGEGVKISILDTGIPRHVDIPKPIDAVNILDKDGDPFDHHGHAAMVSGIIAANNDAGLTGIAPNAKLYTAKIVDKAMNCSYNAIIGSLLWSVVQDCDVVLMSFGAETDHCLIYDAIKKAEENNCCLIAAAGEGDDMFYPAHYPEVFSVAVGDKRCKKNKKADLCFPNMNFFTTYPLDKYVYTQGSSVAAAVTAGLAALIIEQKTKGWKAKDVYEELKELKIKRGSNGR